MTGATDESQQIVWLASFPKSGNTWTRIFLANYYANSSEPVDINKLELPGGISSNRSQFDHLTNLPSSDLTDDEIDLLRPAVYQTASDNWTDTEKKLIVKVHDAYHMNREGAPLFPTSATARAVYLVRNPLDVVVSYTFHGGTKKLGKVLHRMNKTDARMAGNSSQQLRQLTFDWSSHVKSWTGDLPFPVLVLRYEDMLAAPETAFGKLAAFLDLPDAGDEARLMQAVRNSSMKTLQTLENESGFNERLFHAKRFFRKGEAGDWRNHLTQTQAKQILAAHGDVMTQFGYETQLDLTDLEP